MKLWSVFGLLLIPIQLLAYPELSRHGYTNCTSCHLSPSGSGLLTSYGRELSKEVLSTWSNEGEQYFAYNKITPDEKVLLGAYIRGLQALRDSPEREDARTILMQADAEVGYNEKKWAVDASLGRQEIRSGLDSKGRLFSRRHFALYRINDNWTIRFGKFLRFYGLNDPNHNLYVRKDLNFGFDTETYNTEVSQLGENWSFYLTYVDGNLGQDQYTQLKERAGTFSLSYFFNEKQKMGLSYYQGEDSTARRSVGGPWFILSIMPKIFLLSELDWQSKTLKDTSVTQKGYVTSNRLNYEWIQGLISFLSYDKKYLNSDDPNSEQNAYGVGLQFFPRPHIEMVTSWQKETVVNTNSLLAHATLLSLKESPHGKSPAPSFRILQSFAPRAC